MWDGSEDQGGNTPMVFFAQQRVNVNQTSVTVCVMRVRMKKIKNRQPHTACINLKLLLSCFCFHPSSRLSISFLPPSTVWPNGDDRQHSKSRLCQKVHPGLLFRGEAESSLWLVSWFSLMSDHHSIFSPALCSHSLWWGFLLLCVLCWSAAPLQ